MIPDRSNVVIRRTARFHGRVQGVGFRYTAIELSRRFAVTGFVRNCADGSVELVVESDVHSINDFVAALHGAMRSKVESIESVNSQATREFREFSIKR